jgi:hypothetical protein
LVKALKAAAEADAYANSLHEAAEIAVSAARRFVVEPATPQGRGAEVEHLAETR